MTDDTVLTLLLSAVLAAYAIGLLFRLRRSELARLEAERERQEADAWADKWEGEAIAARQALGDLRRQHAALEDLYAQRTRDLMANSHEIVMVNVAWKRMGK